MHKIYGVLSALLVMVTIGVAGLMPNDVLAQSMASSKTSSTTPPIPIHPTVKPGPNCKQPPRDRDPKTLSDAEREMYGYPHRVHGKDFSKIEADIQHFGTHYCQDTSSPIQGVPRQSNFCYQAGNTQPCDFGSNGWGGNIADGNDILNNPYTGQTYNEADFNFKIKCPQPGWNDGYSQWVGLGGFGNNNLIQVGYIYQASYGLISVLTPFWENTAIKGDGGNPQDSKLHVSCGDYMQGQVYSPNCMFLYDLNQHQGDGPNCTGPAANQSSAEFIVERQGFFTNNPQPLSNFGSLEFDSCGVTINGSGQYMGIGATYHDYSNIYNINQNPGSGGHLLDTVGPIWSLSGANPPDSFNEYWQSYS